MESISQLVSDLLARNGIRPSFDCLRLEWSRWFRCDSSFSVLLAPAKPGIFVLAEEIISPADGTKRMLALFEVRETDDLGMALGRLFLPGNRIGEKLASGPCFARYTVIEDNGQRSAAFAIFQRWMQGSTEMVAGTGPCGTDTLVRVPPFSADSVPDTGIGGSIAINAHSRDESSPEPQPSLAFAWGMEAPHQDLQGKIGGPKPLPSGF